MLHTVTAGARVALLAAAALAAPARAQVGPLEVRVEPGLAFFLTSAQQQQYGLAGAAVSARAGLPVWHPVSLQVGASWVAFPFAAAGTPPAAALALGAGARATFQPLWVEAALNGVGTGPNFRFGYELGAGADLAQLGPFHLGPFARFLHVIQPSIALQDPSSAMVLSAGVSLSLPLGEPETAPAAPSPPGPGGPVKTGAPGGKPRVMGSASGEDLVVLTHDKIQIKAPTRFETIRFESGTAQIAKESYLLLATVAKVIFLHPEIRKVRVEGHTDAREVSRELSTRRAEAVRKHLLEMNGVEPERLEAVGHGSDQPVAPNDTPEGRARNRRVEFVIAERADEPVEAPAPLPSVEPAPLAPPPASPPGAPAPARPPEMRR
ncbi:MAG TPA: OmpA family protein [Myxococcales bacterium]|nr:OmpA family protein [Myxococcales bacterium]